LVGWRQALGQAAFGALKTMLQRRSAARLAAIRREHGLDPRPPKAGWQRIGSVNAPACRRVLRQPDPQVVIVYGTRLIQWRTLGCIAAPFITYHAGISGEYRGETGAYWARHQPQRAPAGLTVALIEEGVDGVPYQATVGALPDDNIATDQYRQMASALPLLIRAIEDALKGQLRPPQIELPSRQRFQPTPWGDLKAGVLEQVWCTARLPPARLRRPPCHAPSACTETAYWCAGP
jgi:hypothetical protein